MRESADEGPRLNDERPGMLALITVCFNNPEELEKTLGSVSLQTVRPDEHFVIDSSSPEVAPRMLEMTTNVGATYKWVPPAGVYAAMRHSMTLVDDQHWVWWLNSSDWLAGKRSIEIVMDAIQRAEILGNCKWIVGELLRRQPDTPSVHRVGTSGDEFLNLLQRGRTGFPHPSTIFHSGALRTVDPYVGPYSIASDYATALRFAKKFGQPLLVPNTLTVHDPVGLTSEHPVRNLWEKSRARMQVGSFSQKILELGRLPTSAFRGTSKRIFGERGAAQEGHRLLNFPLVGNEVFDEVTVRGRGLNFFSPASTTPLIFCLTDPFTNGRIARSIEILEMANRKPAIVCPGKASVVVENIFPLRSPFGSSNRGTSFGRLIARLLIWIGFLAHLDAQKVTKFAADRLLGFSPVSKRLSQSTGPILVEDFLLLPSALCLEPKRSVIFDARDLSHKLFENRALWRVTFGKALTNVLASSLPLCDKVITVSDGLANQLLKDFDIHAEVVRSVPHSKHYAPKALQQFPLRIVYMGRADTNRGLEKLIASAGTLAGRVTIHLYLVGHERDVRSLRRKSFGVANVFLHEPVDFDSIIPTLSAYDIGYAALGHKTSNISLALPNKFFEYLFAGIPILVSRGSEMARVLDRFPFGIAIDDSTPERLADALNNLTLEDVERFHVGLREAQGHFNWEDESKPLREFFDI